MVESINLLKMDLDEQMEDDTHILTSAFIYNAKNKAPAHLIEEIQPNYDFDKAALQLQNSKRLLTYLKKVLSFFKNSNETNFVFFGVNGALEKFFIQMLNDSNNLLSNLLDVKCKVVCKEIYDFLEENEGNLEVTVEFQIEEGKITLVYCKNYKSMPQTTSEETSPILHEALTNQMSKNEKLLQKYLIANEKRLKDHNEPLSETYIRTSLQKILCFIRDPSQVTLVFTDLNKNECKFVKSPKQVHKKKHLLDTQSRVLVTAISNALKAKKNWVLGVTERKARDNSLRDVIYEKKPNFDDIPREPNALDILKEDDELQDKNLASHAKLLVDLSTPVISNNAVKIMKGMGWNGGALGIRGNGITEPIMPQLFRNVRSGLGHGVESKKNAPKKYISSDFLINVFATTLDMITKGEDEVTCSSRIQLVNKERSYLNNIFNKLNQRDDTAVGSFGDREYVTDILKAMNDDASLRLVAHLLDDSTVKIIRAKNYASVPPYTPGSNANEYVSTMVNSFGPFYIDDTGISKKSILYDLFTLLLDLVANNYEMKMHISPFYFTHNDLTIIINVVNHINKGKKYGGIFIDRVLYNQILEKVRGYFLDLEFDNVSNHQPENEDNSHLKNSFTIKKIHNKHVGLYRLHKSDNHKIDIVQSQSPPKVDEQQVNNLVEQINSDVNKSESEEKVPLTDENCNTDNNVFTDDVEIETCEKVKENELSSNLIEHEHGAAANDSINSPNEATSMDTECEVVVEENNTNSCPGKDITQENDTNSCPGKDITQENDTNSCPCKDITQENDTNSCPGKDITQENNTNSCPGKDITQENDTNSCPCKDITRSFADQETQTDKFIDDEELKVQEAASNAVDRNDKVDDQNSALSIDSTDIKMKEEDLTDTDSVQSQEMNEKVKNNSPGEWEQLQSDINNLHLLLENEYMNSFLKDDQYKNLKRYKRDIENASKDKFTKTIKIVPLNYPEEGIDTRIVLRIQYLIMEAISEMEQPLLKCHGVQDGALLFSCFSEDSYKFLNKLLINTKTRIIDEKVELTRPRIFMRCNNYLGLSHNEIFSMLNMYNDIRTDDWKIEHFWNSDGFFTFVLEMDENSFEFIKDRGFSLFFGIDRAEFSVLWR